MDFSLRTFDSNRISRVAAGMALVLAGLTGLLAAWWIPRPPEDPKPDTARTLILSENPEPPAANLTAIIQFCAAHTTDKRGFVVFAEGTVALVGEPADNPVAQAVETLRRCAKPDAVFVTEQTTTGDLVVTFTEPVFQWIPSRQRETLADWAGKHLNSLFAPAELAKKAPDWTPAPDARVGLVARKRLLADAKDAKVMKVIRPAISAPPSTGKSAPEPDPLNP
jgi:hypothetical protein